MRLRSGSCSLTPKPTFTPSAARSATDKTYNSASRRSAPLPLQSRLPVTPARPATCTTAWPPPEPTDGSHPPTPRRARHTAGLVGRFSARLRVAQPAAPRHLPPPTFGCGSSTVRQPPRLPVARLALGLESPRNGWDTASAEVITRPPRLLISSEARAQPAPCTPLFQRVSVTTRSARRS